MSGFLKSAANQLTQLSSGIVSRRKTRRWQNIKAKASEVQALESRQLLTGDFVYASALNDSTGDQFSMAVDTTGRTNVLSRNLATNSVTIRQFGDTGASTWTKTLVSSGHSDPEASSIATDSAGNIYVTGTFIGTMDFDPGAGVTNMNHQTGRGFLLKLDSTGAFQWVRQMPAAFSNTVAVSSAGDVFVTGEYLGSYTFATFPVTTDNPLGVGVRGFLSKYSASGEMIWASTFGGTSTPSLLVKQLKTDSAGNAVMMGTVEGNAFGLTNLAPQTTFLAKWSSGGTMSWVRTEADSLNRTISNFAVDPQGQILLTGSFRGTVDMAFGTPVSLRTSLGDFDLFLTRLNANGVFQQTTQFGKSSSANSGVHSVMGHDLTIVGNEAWITGQFQGRIDFNSSSTVINALQTDQDDFDAFVLKVSLNGDYRWVRQFRGSEESSGQHIAVDAGGQITTLGSFQGTTDFDGGIPVVQRNSFNGDTYISRLTPDFLFQTTAAGADELVLRRSGNNLQLFHQGLNSVVDEHPIDQVRSVRISGQPFQADQLTLDFGAGPFGFADGIHFRGSAGTGDSLRILGVAGQSAVYRSQQPGSTSASVHFGTNPVFFADTESVLLSGMTAATVQTMGSRDNLTLAASSISAGVSTTLVTGTSDTTTISGLHLRQIQNVTIDTATSDSTANNDDVVQLNHGVLQTPGLRNLTVSTGAGNDRLAVNTTNLTLAATGGEFRFVAGNGTDRIDATGDVNWTLSNTELNVNRLGRLLLGSVEQSILTGGAGNNTLNAGLFSGFVTLRGMGGIDVLRAGSGGSNLDGGDGDDSLYGGFGNDQLTGGLGVDRYFLNGTSAADSLALTRTSTGATFRRRVRSSNLLQETDTIVSESRDVFRIEALDGDDLISIDSLFAALGTADGGAGQDTYVGNTKWSRISF